MTELNTYLGFCLKSVDGFILSRNAIALETCGQFCDQFCLKNIKTTLSSVLENKHRGLQNTQRVTTREGKTADVVMSFVGDKVVTILYPLDHEISEDMKHYSKYKLTATETNIMERLLRGQSNAQIADGMFISKVTLKKHLNRIYKKIPQELRPR